MTTVNVYLTFNGNCEEAFAFYKSVFGGEYTFFGRFGEMPSQDGVEISEKEKAMVMHVSLPISEETILMGSDTSSQFGPAKVGNNFSIYVNADSREDADRLFNSLSDGGHVTMPIEDTFWGSYFGSFEDKFGINWMVSFDLEQV